MTDRVLLLSTAVAAGALGFVAGRRDANLKRILNGNHVLLTKNVRRACRCGCERSSDGSTHGRSQEKRVVRTLVTQGHKHLFADWPPPGVSQRSLPPERPTLTLRAPGVNDDAKRSLVKTASSYLENASQELEPVRLGQQHPRSRLNTHVPGVPPTNKKTVIS
jgi:hypothetical protein